MYSINFTVKGSFADVEAKITEELKKEGFGILTEIDAQATLKKKLDKDIKPYKILGACNPPFAYKAITAEPEIGVLLPCNVVLRQVEDGEIAISMMDPSPVMNMTTNDEIKSVANEVRAKLIKVKEGMTA